MAYSQMERRDAIAESGIKQLEVARVLDVHPSLVSRVIQGERFEGVGARKVMRYFANILSVPVNMLFPEYERRRKPRTMRTLCFRWITTLALSSTSVAWWA